MTSSRAYRLKYSLLRIVGSFASSSGLFQMWRGIGGTRIASMFVTRASLKWNSTVRSSITSMRSIWSTSCLYIAAGTSSEATMS